MLTFYEFFSSEMEMKTVNITFYYPISICLVQDLMNEHLIFNRFRLDIISFFVWLYIIVLSITIIIKKTSRKYRCINRSTIILSVKKIRCINEVSIVLIGSNNNNHTSMYIIRYVSRTFYLFMTMMTALLF